MSIGHHSGNPFGATVVSAETMCQAIKEKGIIPFFANTIKGYSVEELTAPQFWFDSDENENELGPWDWKIDCIQTGDIVLWKISQRGSGFCHAEVVPRADELPSLIAEIPAKRS